MYHNDKHFFSRGLLSRRLLASAGAVDIGNDPALVATADAFDMGAPPHRWGRSCAKFAAPARSSGILSSEADSPCLAMGGGGSCLKRSCTSGSGYTKGRP